MTTNIAETRYVQRITELETRITALTKENVALTAERDEWKEKAVGLSQIYTYASEKANHCGFKVVK